MRKLKAFLFAVLLIGLLVLMMDCIATHLMGQNPISYSGGGGGGGTTNQTIDEIGMIFDGGGVAISGSATVCKPVTFAGTISGVYISADASGSITIDIQTVLHASYTGPASASSITASAVPALASAVKYTDETLTGWTTTLAAKTDVCFVMSSPATIKWASITLKVLKN